MEITIITPTYNRGENLKKLYESLLNQTNKKFKWLIVDDGSTDNTENIINYFIKQEKLHLKYIKKKNAGKHTALNLGIKQIDTELTFIVDSDDWLTEDAVETILNYHNKYKTKDNLCGYSFLRKFSNEQINGKILKKNEIIDDYINIRINGKDTNSDKAEVWKTKCLKEYYFPEFENEKFLGEDVVWIQLALKYKMVFINQAIYISEYLEDGLTNNRRKNNIKSPNGCYYRAKISINICKKRKVNFKYFIKCLLQYQIYGKFAKKNLKQTFKECEFKIWFIILFPISFILYKKWKHDYIKYEKKTLR